MRYNTSREMNGNLWFALCFAMNSLEHNWNIFDHDFAMLRCTIGLRARSLGQVPKHVCCSYIWGGCKTTCVRSEPSLVRPTPTLALTLTPAPAAAPPQTPSITAVAIRQPHQPPTCPTPFPSLSLKVIHFTVPPVHCKPTLSGWQV